VFATNFAVGDLHASYERHFVKNIQHLSSSKTAFLQPYTHCFMGGFCGSNNILPQMGRAPNTFPKK
ncbi:hypothetical protein, partial [Hoylesella timonensis]|uniref:hypothetical protein n=1 Tax=Hoylesella timonensis TaxID=386414 RepID=UPI000568062D